MAANTVSRETPPTGGMFSGRHAIVTGAGRGIGRAVTLALSAEGAAVTAISRTLSELERVAEDAPGVVTPHALDVRDADALGAAIGGADADLLVCAAGINRPGALVDAKLADLEAVLSVNVLGTLLSCRAFGRMALAAGRGGAAVMISSQMGSVGYPGRSAYCASKHAVDGLTRALALEWAPHGIRVNAVAPTFIRTPFTARMFEDSRFERDVLDRIPLGRIGETEDVVGSVRFLLSDEARLVTGHILAVDGGWTAQ
jgi:NAD(P)-dependent dehydrogenase (short-subunit alcohol dehydrogenase family)